jgi:membrane protein YdbS with pleckstrin-like domain
MGFPRRLLFEGEDIVLDLRPHWWFFAGPASLLVVALLGLIVAAVRGAESWLLLPLAGVVLAALAWFAGRYSRWATTNFVLTSDRVIYRSGVVAKRGIEIPLERINTVFSSQTILERMLRAGDLTVESGGELGRETFSDIPRPGDVQNEIYRQIEANQHRTYGGGRREPDVVDQLDRLDDLRRRGVITDAEFQAKKAKLLDLL